MAWIAENISGTADGWMITLGSEAFSTEDEARAYAGRQMINGMADTVKVYEEWSEFIDDK